MILPVTLVPLMRLNGLLFSHQFGRTYFMPNRIQGKKTEGILTGKLLNASLR
jgi:hypothetical protein